MHKIKLALLSVLAFALSGCGGAREPEPAPQKNAAELAYISDSSPIAKGRLDAAIAPLFDDPRMAETRALLIMYRGKIIAERYGEGYDEDTRFISWSMAKSFTGALIGFLVADGRLVLDDPAPVPAWQRPGDPRGEITLRHLLHMSSGLDHTEVPEAGGKTVYEADTNRMLFLDGAQDTAAYAEARPMEATAGEKFEYSTATTIILSDIITRTLTNSSDPLVRRDVTLRFIRGRLLEPLGMDGTYPEFDPNGTFLGGSFIQATARDYARFGEFLRHNGARKGAKHLPVSWVQFMKTSSENDPAYGGHLWLNKTRPEGRNQVLFPDNGPDTIFAALGHLGQQIVVSPEQKLTVVRLGKTQDDVLAPMSAQIGRIMALFPVGS
ncbi:MAG: serine hydrolase [Sphingomonadales bacterium]|nr:serine hydrolase [Sphingomonadales bacterium]PIX66690.1 MAG: serine hydrolase [Sphingomonadales bacterium CG_4_10_14_3_um_filter_58_15]NCO48510.1 serine hydrolase [Sphingomonadales bacterium]NCO99326.1 serine hydrolase [Sphingomonadales bacterium]NCP27885.1 serine hydrolase [Sphingomonadales bacterium]